MSHVIFKLKSERSTTKAEVEHLEERLRVERRKLEDIELALAVLVEIEKKS